ncbi:hypothetical protein K491DRAFT_709950 [Lophiostoma macrostomum CBS 122681]|uniref:Uncharacterized protein n=1 Tax=Lophiostoma macrostomum CBS 122681 TaxID=1314788 RepID=A0A6A6TRA9_9PLEO|nr:hypothetical protein K491DRAFT_709950 [Lophiostoma macrostomum CBS 122681]
MSPIKPDFAPHNGNVAAIVVYIEELGSNPSFADYISIGNKFVLEAKILAQNANQTSLISQSLGAIARYLHLSLLQLVAPTLYRTEVDASPPSGLVRSNLHSVASITTWINYMQNFKLLKQGSQKAQLANAIAHYSSAAQTSKHLELLQPGQSNAHGGALEDRQAQ